MLLLSACLPAANLAQSGTAAGISPQPPTAKPTAAATGTSTPTSQPATATATATPTAIASASPPAASATAPTPTLVLVKQGPGKVVCPILLYHVIADLATPNPYAISPLAFREQMQALKDWGYSTISATQLAEAINFGAKLPERPVLITFDDGDETVYSQAYPIMREFGFTGVNYLVVNYIGAPGHMSVDQVKELGVAGWEAGSHSISHVDLTKIKSAELEIVQSRVELEKLLGLPVATFAYPFGKMSPNMLSSMAKNYRAGMGLGNSDTQTRADLYYLWRRPVEPGWDVSIFGSYLPWNTPPGE